MTSEPTRSRVSRPKRTNGGGKPKLANASAKRGQDQLDSTTSENLCIICAEERPYLAISPCNNITCYVCCFRQRALFGKNVCLVCRTEHPDVIFCELLLSLEPRYDELQEASKDVFSDRYGVHFTSMEVHDATMALLEETCPVCSSKFNSFDALSDHTRTVHFKQYCNICASHKKAFVSELTLYNAKLLNKHMTEGDYEGFHGHPKCKFCRNQRFYSDDELHVHIRDRHERCYICDQDGYKIQNYYRNYDHLYEHFKDVHYVCSVPSCVEKRFVVFREDLDLTAHMLKEHGGLTGMNGRVVVGASNYQSQLSTFPRNGSSRNDSGNNDHEDSMEVKRSRLEERARHYLLANEAKLDEFKQLNKLFKSRKIDASQLLNHYNELFDRDGNSDIALLVYELAGLYPQHSDQRKQLEEIYGELVPANTSSPSLKGSFPKLGNGSSSSISLLSWGPNMGSSKKNLEDLFPKLSKPSRLSSPVVKNQPIKYVTVKQKPQAKPQPTVNSFKGNSNYKPSYLDNLTPTNSTSALPVLGTSLLNSPSSSAQASRSQSPVTIGAGSSGSKLSDKQFPALQKKTTKKEIPRVNPISSGSGLWGSGLALPAPKAAENDDFGIPIIDKKALKRKGKGRK